MHPRSAAACALAGLSDRQPLLGLHLGRDLPWSWLPDPAPVTEYHLNSVTAKSEVPALHRPPVGIGRERCTVAANGCTVPAGLDAFVFTAGIGENSRSLRERVCSDAAWLGIDIDRDANERNQPRMSTAASRVSAWIIPTNEELMIARHTKALLAGASQQVAA